MTEQLELAGERAVGSEGKLLEGMMAELSAQGRWVNANELSRMLGLARSEYAKRRLRLAAEESGGEVAGGQRGYKLVRCMTAEEYQHFRNWMKSQADEMLARILATDKVFYARQAVRSGNGIL